MEGKPSKPSNKWCIVPMCTSTSRNAPKKIFITVPLVEKRRKSWFKAIRRNYSDVSTKSSCFVCEDHFSLPVDSENWLQYSMKYSSMIKLKKDVVPHKFDCQRGHRLLTQKNLGRTFTKKRIHASLVSTVLKEEEVHKSDTEIHGTSEVSSGVGSLESGTSREPSYFKNSTDINNPELLQNTLCDSMFTVVKKETHEGMPNEIVSSSITVVKEEPPDDFQISDDGYHETFPEVKTEMFEESPSE